MHAAKDELRQKMRELRRALGSAEAQELADRAAPHVLHLPEVVSARRVALYAPVRGEIDTRSLHAALTARGVRVAYPRIVDAPALELCDADLEGLSPGRHGIPTPTGPALDPGDIDVFLVPGLAFDPAGERLGWGRGHYDRTLAGAPAALRVGYAYGFQIVPAVPAHADDERMDVVVTEAGARRMSPPHLRRLR